MIQVYKPGTSLSRNGDMVLTPSECTVTAKLNEVWTLEMVHPIDPEGRWEYIVEEGVLKVPTWQDSEQFYRIASIEKTESSVSVVAYPIFLDTRNRIFIDDLTVRGSAQMALNQMLALGPTDPDDSRYALFKATATVSPLRTINFAMRNFMDCLNGNEEPTITGMYGGEFEYDNFRLYLSDRIGTDNDVYVRYGKNIAGIEYAVDYSEIVTRIYPVAYGDHTISSGTKYVNSAKIGSYDMIYAKMVMFDNIRMASDVNDDEAANYIICNSQSEMDTQLRNAAARKMADGADAPKVSIRIDMVSLADSDQYADISNFETIRLGDTVHCVHERLGVVSDTRAVGITWDCAKNRIRTIELGEFTYDYMREISGKIDAIANITNSDGTIMAERVRGFLDGTKTAIHILRTSATTAHVMAVLFEDKVSGSPTYGALGIGTKGLMVAKEWDDDLDDWAWETAITADGVLSPMIVTNTISGASAQNWWDLQLGQISFQTISNDIDSRDQEVKDALIDIIDNLDTDMTGIEICNAIFGEGAIKGFQTRTNPTTGKTEFYLSFDAFIGGQGQLGGYQNGNGVLVVQNSDGDESVKLDNTGIKLTSRSLKNPGKIFGYSGSTHVSTLHLSDTSNSGGWSQTWSMPGKVSPKGIYAWGISAYSQESIVLCGESIGFAYYDQADRNSGDGTWPDVKATVDPNGFHCIGKMHLHDVGYTYETEPKILALKSDDEVAYYTSSSSIRYKHVYGLVKKEDIQDAYKVKVYMARYKDGHLVKTDRRNGKTYPMFIAEQMLRHLPIAVDLNEKGKAETWNERAIIPIMFQMIKDQKESIDSLESKLSEACDRITKLENLVSSLMEGK